VENARAGAGRERLPGSAVALGVAAVIISVVVFFVILWALSSSMSVGGE
jgi:ABC-type uncharacterized transport system fused permease/ATPase subunit